MLGKLPVPGRPTNLDYSRVRACCACSRCGWGDVWTFFPLIYPFSPLSPSLWETVRYRLKYCLKRPLNPKQPTNQPTTAQMKFASEARPSQYIVPFDNTGPTCMPLSGHFMDIKGRVLVHQTERYQLSLPYNTSW